MSLAVVLVRTRNPLNIGAVARAMSNFGFSDLRLVAPYEPSFREARSAVGSAEILRQASVFETVADAVHDRQFVFGTSGASRTSVTKKTILLHAAGPEIRQRIEDADVALLFGSEKTGLSNEELLQCHRVVQVPTREEHPSMNLGQAVAVCLYELARPTEMPPDPLGKPRATMAELERLYGVFLEALSAAAYVKPRTEAATAALLRELLLSLELSPEATQLLTGMMRKIRNGLRHLPDP